MGESYMNLEHNVDGDLIQQAGPLPGEIEHCSAPARGRGSGTGTMTGSSPQTPVGTWAHTLPLVPLQGTRPLSEHPAHRAAADVPLPPSKRPAIMPSMERHWTTDTHTDTRAHHAGPTVSTERRSLAAAAATPRPRENKTKNKPRAASAHDKLAHKHVQTCIRTSWTTNGVHWNNSLNKCRWNTHTSTVRMRPPIKACQGDKMPAVLLKGHISLNSS